MNITDADYDTITTYVYELDTLDHSEKQLSVGELIDGHGRKF